MIFFSLLLFNIPCTDLPPHIKESLHSASKRDAQGNVVGCSNTCHSYKRKSVNTLASSGLPTHSFVGFCGWAIKTIHSIFDYLVHCSKQDSQCALVVAGWTIQLSNGTRQGGYSPMEDDISTSRDKVQPFIRALFGG